MITFPVLKYTLLGLLGGEWVEDWPGTGVRGCWHETVAVETTVEGTVEKGLGFDQCVPYRTSLAAHARQWGAPRSSEAEQGGGWAAGCGGGRGGVDRCVDRQMGRQVGTWARGRLVGAGWLAAGSLVFSMVLVDQSRRLTG